MSDALREAAQQVLEALESLQGGCTDSDDGTVEAITVWCPEIIDALKAALAEPVQEEEGLIEFLADLQRSRIKYPNNRRMFDGLMGEVDELRRAYAGDGDIRAEAFDVAVCAFRIATEGDSGGNTMLEQAEPVQEPEDFDHGIGADRFKVVRGAYWWHVLIGDSPTKRGKFHTQAGAEEMAALLLREFRNGAFVQHKAALAEPEYPLGQATTDVGVPVYVVKKAEPVQEPCNPSCAPGYCYCASLQRKPLTEEEIEAAYRNIYRNLPYAFDHSTPSWVEAGIRYAERAHGII